MGLAAGIIYSPMRRLCGYDRPMAGLEHDYQALLQDPLTRLSEGPIEFQSLGWRLYLIWLPMFLLCESIATAFLTRVQGNPGKTYIAWGAIVCCLLLYLVLPILLLSRKIQLNTIGFRIIRQNKQTLVPWNCLQANRDWCAGIFQIMVAVRGAAKDQIVTIEDGETVTHANGGKLVGLSFENATEIKIIWPFRLDPDVFLAIAAQMSAQPSLISGE